MGSSRVGSNPTRSADLFAILILLVDTKLSALSGNRTPVSRVAGENSTTEPTMRGRKEVPGARSGSIDIRDIRSCFDKMTIVFPTSQGRLAQSVRASC